MHSFYRTPVLNEWTDYNGHLRDANYLLIFSYATDALMDHIGLDEEGRARTGHTLFTLEVHLNYLAEVKRDEVVEVRTQVVDHDGKRLHIHHGLYREGEEQLLAASEQMLMNIDTLSGRSASWHADVLGAVERLAASDSALPRPEHCGRVIGLPQR